MAKELVEVAKSPAVQHQLRLVVATGYDVAHRTQRGRLRVCEGGRGV